MDHNQDFESCTVLYYTELHMNLFLSPILANTEGTRLVLNLRSIILFNKQTYCTCEYVINNTNSDKTGSVSHRYNYVQYQKEKRYDINLFQE